MVTTIMRRRRWRTKGTRRKRRVERTRRKRRTRRKSEIRRKRRMRRIIKLTLIILSIRKRELDRIDDFN